MNAFDFVDDDRLFLSSSGQFFRLPLVVSGGRDLQHSTLSLGGPTFSIFKNELASQLFSFTKKAVAFFKMSRSILSCLFSALRRFNSASTDVL